MYSSWRLCQRKTSQTKHRTLIVSNMTSHQNNNVNLCNLIYNKLFTDVEDPQCAHCNFLVRGVSGLLNSSSIDRSIEQVKSYNPEDGQKGYITCFLCQLGLSELPWESRALFRQEASIYVKNGLFDPNAPMHVRMEQLAYLLDMEKIPLVARSVVEAKMTV